jgi:ubiquinone/menaquinone biosynthesis C-methylase UbiE
MKTELLQQCSLCAGDLLDVLDPECNIVRCRNCGFVFDNPRPTLEELIAFYSRGNKYDSWLTELGPRERVWKKRLRIMEPYKKPGSLLDVGTGIGQFLSMARSSFAKVLGTEVSTTAIQIAKERYDLSVFEGSIDNLAKRSQTFDNITMFHVLEHVPDPRATLKSCHALLSAGGILVIAVPNEISSLRAFTKRLLANVGFRNAEGVGKLGLPLITLQPSTPEVHLSHFTPKVLSSVLRSTGFSIVKSTLDPYRLLVPGHRIASQAYYYSCLLALQLFKVNLYDTMLVIARKSATKEEVSAVVNRQSH